MKKANTIAEAQKMLWDAQKKQNHVAVSFYQKEINSLSKRDRITVFDLSESMTDKDGAKLKKHVNMQHVLIDCLESNLLEINSVINKYEQGSKIEAYDTIQQLLRILKKQIKVVDKIFNEEQAISFGEIADSAFEFIENKLKRG